MSADVRFRSARAADLPALVALLADDALGQARETVSDPVAECYVKAFERLDDDPLNEIVVMEVEGEVAGFAQLTVIPGLSRRATTRGLIESVRVSSQRRGQGLGELLFRELIERARQAGCGLVQLTTDRKREDAHRFYERLGFEATHVGMKLDLSAAH